MSPTRRNALGRAAFIALALYAVAAIAANALGWSVRFDDRAIENRPFDYNWELSLPWRASHGEWVGRDFAYPIGPLWQALALIPNLGQSFSAVRSVVGMHVVFPLLSLVIAALLSLRTFRDWPRRAAAFGAIALFALHDDVRTFRVMVNLAIVIAYVHEGTARRRVEPFVVGALAGAVSLVSFDVAILGLLSVLAMTVVEVWLGEDRKRALERLGSFSLGVTAIMVVLAAVLRAGGGSFFELVRGSLTITRTYAFAVAIRARGIDVAAVLAFVILAYAIGLSLFRKVGRDRVAMLWFVGAGPLVARAVVRTDVEHVYSGLMPLAVVLVLVALRHAPERRRLAAAASLLSITFALAWFGSYRERPNASSPIAFWRAAKILSGKERRTSGYDGDLPRIVRFLSEQRRDSSVSCVGLPLGAEVVHALSDTPGPTQTALFWSPSLREELAERIRREKCPWFVDRVASFDRSGESAAVGFGPDRVAISELYEPAVRLGPWMFASRLRSEPLVAQRAPLSANGLGTREIDVDSKWDIELARPVSTDHIVAVEYTLELTSLTVLAGRSPLLVGNFWQGGRPLAAPTVLAPEVNRRATAFVPVSPEFTEWRWVSGESSRFNTTADKLVIGVESRGPPLGPIRLTVHSLTEILPPASARPADPKECEARIDLAARAHERGFARAVAPEITAESIIIPPNPKNERLAEVFTPVRPCRESCLFSELFVDSPMGTGDGVDYEIHVIDGPDRPRLIDWHVDPGISPKLAVLPLGKWASRDILIRFGTLPGKTTLGDRARFDRARIGPCLVQRNLVHDLHTGALEVVRGQTRVLGDTLELYPTQRGAAAIDARLPIEPAKDSCLALDFQAKRRSDASVPLGIEAAILDGDEVVRLARAELDPDAPLMEFKELTLGEWANRHVELRFSAWPLLSGEPSVAVIFRPRIHTCGDPARWEFARDAR